MSAPIDPALPLGEVIMRLSRAARLSKFKNAARLHLLELLKRGDLSAFFLVPASRGLEIRIPPSYWAQITLRRFAWAAYGHESGKGGTYKVNLYAFDQTLAELIERNERKGETKADRIELIRKLISFDFKTPEACIRQSEFELWLKQAGYALEDQLSPEKKRKGRPLGKREFLYEGIARVLARELKAQGNTPKFAAAAKQLRVELVRLARGNEKDVLKEDALRTEISDLFE